MQQERDRKKKNSFSGKVYFKMDFNGYAFWTVVSVSFVVNLTPSTVSSEILTTQNGELRSKMLHIPNEWVDMCTFEKTFVKSNRLTAANDDFVQMSCFIQSSREWSFSTFKNWSSALSDISIALEISCVGNGTAYIPWPVTDKNLKYFTVSNCDIKEFMKLSILDRQNSSQTENPLKVFEITDSRIFIDVKVLIDIVKNMARVSQSADCGPEKAERFVWRNTSTEFIGLRVWIATAPPEDMDLLSKALSLFDVAQKKKYMCVYPNLKIMDFSFGLRSKYDTHFLSLNGRFPRLERYNMSFCNIGQIPISFQNWRSSFPRIHYVDLSHNHINDLILRDAGQYKDLEHGLGSLDLRHNNFTVITSKHIETLRQLSTVVVNLRDNPFVCDCEMQDFWDTLHSGKHLKQSKLENYEYLKQSKLENYEYFWFLTCTSPKQLAGRLIAELQQSDFCPLPSNNSSELRTVIIILSVFVVMLSVAIFLLLKYRHEVRILIFTRLNIIVPCEIYEYDSTKEYDAFISYSSLDLDWVIKTLLPMLENQSKENFKLCLHHKDFVPGKAIAENILDSVEKSRHTILIVSNNFLRSEWCLYEFRSAFHQSLREKRRHLIIILLEEVPLSGLESDLKRCLETFTYIKASDKLFFDRVTYALSKKRRFHRSVQMEVSAPKNGDDKSTIENNDIECDVIQNKIEDTLEVRTGKINNDGRTFFGDCTSQGSFV